MRTWQQQQAQPLAVAREPAPTQGSQDAAYPPPTHTHNTANTNPPPPTQVERATVILREMPSDTPEAKLRAFFDGLPGCPPIKGLRADVNDMWCVRWGDGLVDGDSLQQSKGDRRATLTPQTLPPPPLKNIHPGSSPWSRRRRPRRRWRSCGR